MKLLFLHQTDGERCFPFHGSEELRIFSLWRGLLITVYNEQMENRNEVDAKSKRSSKAVESENNHHFKVSALSSLFIYLKLQCP